MKESDQFHYRNCSLIAAILLTVHHGYIAWRKTQYHSDGGYTHTQHSNDPNRYNQEF